MSRLVYHALSGIQSQVQRRIPDVATGSMGDLAKHLLDSGIQSWVTVAEYQRLVDAVAAIQNRLATEREDAIQVYEALIDTEVTGVPF